MQRNLIIDYYERDDEICIVHPCDSYVSYDQTSSDYILSIQLKELLDTRACSWCECWLPDAKTAGYNLRDGGYYPDLKGHANILFIDSNGIGVNDVRRLIDDAYMMTERIIESENNAYL